MSNDPPLQLSLFPDQNFAAPKKKQKQQKALNNSLDSYLEQQKAKLSASWQQLQGYFIL